MGKKKSESPKEITEQEKEFLALYDAYFRYIFKYEVGYEEDFKDFPEWNKEEFLEQLSDAGLNIKKRDGY